MSDRTLDVGMLLLGGNHGKNGEPLNTVYMVTSVGERGASILARSRLFNVKARLKSDKLPPGWRIVDNKTLARLLADLPHDYNFDRDRSAAYVDGSQDGDAA